MAFRELIVLLPCHSLDDFPTYLEAAETDNLLACCTASWHPALIDTVKKLPTWCRADVLPLDLSETILVVPQVSEGWLPCDFADRVEAEKPLVLRTESGRDELVRQALAAIPEASTFDTATVADFYALGFCRLHVELLTRVTRYTTTIDDIRLQDDVLKALGAASLGEREKTREQLTRCFELLCESRRYFFPVDPYLIDLTLVADSTVGETLRQEISAKVPKNLLVSGQVIERMGELEPESVAAIREGLSQKYLSLVGGEYEEREFPLLPEEVWRADLARGIATYQQVLDHRPIVYGRRRAGLSPLLPQLLCRTGFLAALHFTLDDGQFPITANAKTRWDSPDGSVVEALAQIPLDAAQAVPFLDLPRRLGETMDREQVATLIFAHWPASASVWYDDLLRASSFSPVLGKFITVEEYFSLTLTATSTASFESDDYRMPYLQQAWGSADSISTRQREFHKAIETISASGIGTMAAMLTGSASPDDWETCVRAMAAANPSGQPAICAANGCSFLTRWSSETCKLDEPSPLVVSSDSIDVPAMGFTWVGTSAVAAASPAPKRADQELSLGNEFFRVLVSPETGGIQAIYNERGRSNRMSQQIALRSPGARGSVGSAWRDPDETAVYSRMIAESTEIISSSEHGGTITSRGRIISEEGQLHARFVQRTGVAAGSRIITIHIKLEDLEEPVGLPWDNYFALRCAFADAELKFRRNLGMSLVETKRRRFDAPLMVAVEEGKRSTAILPHGLPFHRRVGPRTLDTLLTVRGETNRSFQLGIGVDLPHPISSAIEDLTILRGTVVPNAPPQGSSGWFFHIDARNVLATAWEPIEGGFRVRLQETRGAEGSICLRAWKSIQVARQTDFLGNTLCELSVQDDKIKLDIRSHEWIQVEARFAS